MILGIHVSFWWVNLSQMRAHLHDLSIILMYVHSTKRVAKQLCYDWWAFQQALVMYRALEHEWNTSHLNTFSLFFHSLSSAAIAGWHLHFHFTRFGCVHRYAQQLNSISNVTLTSLFKPRFIELMRTQWTHSFLFFFIRFGLDSHKQSTKWENAKEKKEKIYFD